MPLYFREIGPGVLFEGDNFTVSAFPVTHRGPDCLGYIFEEKARRPFLNDRATELGVPFGPERRLLVEGQTITLADGRIITPDDVLHLAARRQTGGGGDTGRIDDLVEPARGRRCAGHRIHLSGRRSRDGARQFSHMTARGAAELAKQAGVKT